MAMLHFVDREAFHAVIEKLAETPAPLDLPDDSSLEEILARMGDLEVAGAKSFVLTAPQAQTIRRFQRQHDGITEYGRTL